MWAIVGMQRSGTHLLASLLRSHPDLDVEGEVLEEDSVIPEDKGCILMYNQIDKHDAYDRLKGVKIVHLVRGIADNAYSLAILDRRERLGMTPHAHEVQEVLVPEIGSVELRAWKRAIRQTRKIVMDKLEADVFEISYEYICGGNKEVLELSKEKAAPLLEFLGVEPMVLTTGLRKTRYTSENSS